MSGWCQTRTRRKWIPDRTTWWLAARQSLLRPIPPCSPLQQSVKLLRAIITKPVRPSSKTCQLVMLSPSRITPRPVPSLVPGTSIILQLVPISATTMSSATSQRSPLEKSLPVLLQFCHQRAQQQHTARPRMEVLQALAISQQELNLSAG